MPEKCNAVAASTSQQCKRNSLPGSHYCVLHQEKAPLVLGAVLGALLSLVVFEVWRMLIPSTEARHLVNARNAIADVRAQHETAKIERSNLEGRVLSLRAQLAESEAKAARDQAQFERELRQRSEEISALNRRTLDAVTGGSSFCYLSIFSATSEIGQLMFVHQGDDTLYDVTVRLVDLDRFEERKGSLTLDDLHYTDTSLSLGTLIAGHSSMRGRVNLSSFPDRGYNVFFAARNGSFHQLLRLKKVAGVWKQALKVMRDEETIFEKTNDDYPRDENSNVEW